MSANTIIIRELSRLPRFHETDRLEFTEGVNVIAGEKDAGKTKWLSMLNYLMGDTERNAKAALGETIAEKYDSVAAIIEISGEKIHLERNWKTSGLKTKILINGNPKPTADFSNYILEKLNIPRVQFPKGNPTLPSSWTAISWRNLLRHIYRQERFWSDFAEKQYTSEQHACLALFLGAAEQLFPEAANLLYQSQRKLIELHAKKEMHISLLSTMTNELLNQHDTTTHVTEASITESINMLRMQTKDLEAERSVLLQQLHSTVASDATPRLEQLQTKLSSLNAQIVDTRSDREKAARRHDDLVEYFSILKAELGRIERVKSSGRLFADLKVTQCPVCDKDVSPDDGHSGDCYLCHKPYLVGDAAIAERRISFEEAQVREEAEEMQGIIDRLQANLTQLDARLLDLSASAHRIDTDLQPTRQATASVLPPDIAITDRQLGRISEQLDVLSNVQSALRLQKTMGEQIEVIRQVETDCRTALDTHKSEVDLEEISNTFQSRMNLYLRKISADDPSRWQHGDIEFRLRQRDFTIKLKGASWNKEPGATSQALVLFAYHYALLSLVADKRFNYPGLVIIDFPVQLADGTSIDDKENYLMDPFVDLCRQPGMGKSQVIVSGRSFKDLQGVRRNILPNPPHAVIPMRAEIAGNRAASVA